jgi:hypothetical protein
MRNFGTNRGERPDVRFFGVEAAGKRGTPTLAACRAEVVQWPMTTLRERLVKNGAKIVRHGRFVILQMAEVIVSGADLQQILDAIAALRRRPDVDKRRRHWAARLSAG